MPEAVTTEDASYDPAASPGESQPWLNLLDDAEKKFRSWQEKCDNVDQLYADLERQASSMRDRQFAMFWANIQVLAPSVYARKPVPVVVPEFKDRDPIKRTASEMLERALIHMFEADDIDGTMRLCRDDMLIDSRGVLWVRYETKAEARKEYGASAYERCCVEFLDRTDFRHEPARNWKEVGWVARRAWLTRKAMKARFAGTVEGGEEALLSASYVKRVDGGRDGKPKEGAGPEEKCGVWEIWHKHLDKVVWVTEGIEVVLDEDKPHLDLDGFFPCPKPAYGTLQRRTLIPIPDIAYYKDQLEEINKLTARIHALSDAIQVKGFYPGGGEIGDAVEAALSIMDDRKVMIPVSNFAAFGGGGEVIVWLPIDMIATTIAGLIEMRRQIIDDVYQIVGLSDIMRGSVDPEEKLGQSQLKSQYGSIRIRDKQTELVRVARDAARIVGEIMAEHFSKETLLAMSQMSLPTRAEIAKEVKGIEAQVKQQAAQIEQQVKSPEAQQMAQRDPEQAQQALQQIKEQAQQALEQAQAQIEELQGTPTIDDVMELLRDERIRPFALDIETDSTIQPDEDAEKQRRAEFLQVLGGLMAQLAQLVETKPEAAAFAGEVLKFGLAPYRVGRQLEGAIDEFVAKLEQSAGQDKPESPEQIKAKAEAERMNAEMQMRQQESERAAQVEQMKLDADAEARQMEADLKMQEIAAEGERKDRELQAKMAADQQKHAGEMQKLQLEIVKLNKEIEAKSAEIAIGQEQARQDAGFREREFAQKEALAERSFARDEKLAERSAARDDKAAERQAMLAERMAASRAAGQGNGASRG